MLLLLCCLLNPSLKPLSLDSSYQNLGFPFSIYSLLQPYISLGKHYLSSRQSKEGSAKLDTSHYDFLRSGISQSSGSAAKYTITYRSISCPFDRPKLQTFPVVGFNHSIIRVETSRTIETCRTTAMMAYPLRRYGRGEVLERERWVVSL